MMLLANGVVETEQTERTERVTVANGQLPRYDRPHEHAPNAGPVAPDDCVPFARAADILAASPLSPGSRALLLGLLRTGTTRVFPGGGIGIEYGSLLKTAARPDYLAAHIREVAAHLRAHRADLLLVPGMSGYPVGSMYALGAGLPALLLKKQKYVQETLTGFGFPTGSFVIPSYTGEGDVVISADLDAVRDIVACIVEPQLAAQRDAATLTVTIRAAGADDIIDKATMAHAITESAPLFCQAALDDVLARHRARTGDARPVETIVEVVTWVTPLIKTYNQPREHLMRWFGIEPFAGVRVSSVHLEPCALGVEGVGVLAFAE